MTTRKPVVGLIGGIGSGKSTVAEAFARRGAQVISGDRLGHEALRQPTIREQVVAHFGQGVLDEQGEIDRRRLGAMVFADPAWLRALEKLVFPYIERRFPEEVAAARQDPRIALIVFDAAVLLEAGWNKWCDRVVYVDAPPEVRLARLARQRGWSAKEVQARENSQLPLAEKKARADFVIDNAGPPEQRDAQVDRLLRVWDLAPSQVQM